MAPSHLTRLAIAGVILSVALPLSARANEPGPGPVHPAPRSDTLTKLDKTKSERPAPSSKKKLKPSKTTPSGSPSRSEFVPDQPWETEFYVENDVSGRQAMQLALASFNPRR